MNMQIVLENLKSKKLCSSCTKAIRADWGVFLGGYSQVNRLFPLLLFDGRPIIGGIVGKISAKKDTIYKEMKLAALVGLIIGHFISIVLLFPRNSLSRQCNKDREYVSEWLTSQASNLDKAGRIPSIRPEILEPFKAKRFGLDWYKRKQCGTSVQKAIEELIEKLLETFQADRCHPFCQLMYLHV